MKDLKQGHLTWTAISRVQYTYAEAEAYVASFGEGWRLPTKDELASLYKSGALEGLGWTLTFTWSSTPDSAGSHYVVSLGTSNVLANDDTDFGYVSCVREDNLTL